MKKLLLLWFLVPAAQLVAQETPEEDQTESVSQEDSDESEMPPITVNITIANNTDAQSSNKTNVIQAQAVVKEDPEKKKQDEKKRAMEHARTGMNLAYYLLRLVR